MAWIIYHCFFFFKLAFILCRFRQLFWIIILQTGSSVNYKLLDFAITRDKLFSRILNYCLEEETPDSHFFFRVNYRDFLSKLQTPLLGRNDLETLSCNWGFFKREIEWFFPCHIILWNSWFIIWFQWRLETRVCVCLCGVCELSSQSTFRL